MFLFHFVQIFFFCTKHILLAQMWTTRSDRLRLKWVHFLRVESGTYSIYSFLKFLLWKCHLAISKTEIQIPKSVVYSATRASKKESEYSDSLKLSSFKKRFRWDFKYGITYRRRVSITFSRVLTSPKYKPQNIKGKLPMSKKCRHV